jgi:hypothetical protein
MMAVDLYEFCYQWADRPYMHHPINIGAWTYATNGHIAVRVARMPEHDTHERDFVPNIQSVLFDEPVDGSLVSVNLKSAGPVVLFEEDEYSHQAFSITPMYATIFGVPFDRRYISKLRLLPQLRLEFPPRSRSQMKFGFEGGIGVVMAVTSWAENFPEVADRMDTTP